VPKLRNLRQPVIAAVDAPGVRRWPRPALASDIRIAAVSATFNAAFARIGLSDCDIGVSRLLPRLIGAGRSRELLLTGRLVDAAKADRIGLVNRVVPGDEMLDTALTTAAQITADSPMGGWMTKEVAWSQLEAGSLQALIDLENRTQIMTTFTRDHSEQVTAFLEKGLRTTPRAGTVRQAARWTLRIPAATSTFEAVADGPRSPPAARLCARARSRDCRIRAIGDTSAKDGPGAGL
jgi:enoyl-CoA hydratase